MKGEVEGVRADPYILMEQYRAESLQRDIDSIYGASLKDLWGCCLMCGWVMEECDCEEGDEQN